jgi:hypothetical protein
MIQRKPDLPNEETDHIPLLLNQGQCVQAAESGVAWLQYQYLWAESLVLPDVREQNFSQNSVNTNPY